MGAGHKLGCGSFGWQDFYGYLSAADSDSPGQTIYATSWKNLVVKNMVKTLRTEFQKK